MTCEHEDLLTAYVDGELPAPEREAVRAHLAGCPGCRGTEALLRSTAAGLRRHAEGTPVPDVRVAAARRAVLARIEEEATPRWVRALRARWRPRIGWPVLGAAAAAALALMVRGGGTGQTATVDADRFELVKELELLSDYDVLGLEEPGDLALVTRLHELEVR